MLVQDSSKLGALGPWLIESLVRLTAVDEWLILSKRNFKFDLGDALLVLPSDKRGNIDEGTTAFCWIAQRSAEEAGGTRGVQL